MGVRLSLIVVFLLPLLCLNSPNTTSHAIGDESISSNTSDWLALIALKNNIASHPSGVLSLWNSTTHFCSWEGVSCSSRRHPERVTAIDLASRGLVGTISPSISNLTFLTTIHLGVNLLHGRIPGEFGRLRYLQYLNISFNSLDGEFPANLSHCTQLRFLDLDQNQLTGSLPIGLGSLSKLLFLGLFGNNLTGAIPSSLGNLSSLTLLDLPYNHFDGGIPAELGNLADLNYFNVGENLLSGFIPEIFFNLSKLHFFGIAGNQLSDDILPPDLGLTLPNLRILYLGGNRFYGPIPTSLSNASNLQEIDLSLNRLSGRVPSNLGGLQYLNLLNLEKNQLGENDDRDWLFLDSLTNCSRLKVLSVSYNNLGGTFPTSVANLSAQLVELYLGGNQIRGTIPSGLQNLVNLISLQMQENILSGWIPESIGRLKRLQVLALDKNQLTGPIPNSLGNLTQLTDLILLSNHLEGPIPSSLGRLQHANILDLSTNKLSGSIPKEILGLNSLSNFLDLSHNYLVGSLPSDVGGLRKVQAISVGGNNLTGEIPESLGDCESLEVLFLGRNLLQGSIPPSLSKLHSLLMLDLSGNRLSGDIPYFLQNLTSLYFLNLSFNQLHGEVPIEGVFKNATGILVQGNDGLCGGIPELQLPPCPLKTDDRSRSPPMLKIGIAIPVAISALFVCILFAFIYWKRYSRNKHLSKLSRNGQLSTSPSSKYHFPRISYRGLVRATDSFSSSNLIGRGSHGSVYKGTLDDRGTIVAVKVFHLQQSGASKSFLAECRALQGIRHRNLLRILTSCSSIDSRGDDFKALVFEFMPNGSLEMWLHPEEDGHHQPSSLTMIQRLGIALNVAHGLEYLHHNCRPQVVHCDLKPSNVLLDDDMNAHVGDFGLSKIFLDVMSKPLQDSSNMIGIRGSIGYIPPEYATGSAPSSSGDVYSYGILLLEMFTGKSPVDEMFKDGLTLRGLVEMAASSEQVWSIAEPLILNHEVEVITNKFEKESSAERIQKCLLSIVEIGLSCSNQSPNKRMSMETVASKMQAVKNAYVGDRISTKA